MLIALEKYLLFTRYVVYFEENARLIFDFLKGIEVDDIEEMLNAWFDYFANDFKFPQNGIVTDSDFRSRVKEGDTVKLLKINDLVDDHYGILVDCNHKTGKATIPLCDIEIETDSEDALLLKAEFKSQMQLFGLNDFFDKIR